MRPLHAPLLVILGALLACLVGLTACRSPSGETRGPSALAGTSDVALTYEIDGVAQTAPAAFGEDLRALVLRRLVAGQSSADVTEDGARVRVVVDEALASRADELLTWSGTLVVYESAPDIVFSPRDDASGLVAKREGNERWYEGERADILRAIESGAPLHEHRVLAEPLAIAEPYPNDSPLWRTRVVAARPIGELGDGALVGWGQGPTLRVRGAQGSPSAEVIRLAQQRADVVVARGRISLGAPTFTSDAVVLSFGAGAEAYARAKSERRLLTTPRLPPLRRVDATRLPPNRNLALACLVVPIALSFAWLLFVRRFDRAHPEPMWLIGVTFALGALATIPAALIQATLARMSPWLDPNLATFGGQTFALPLSFLVFTVVVGLSEEGAKRLAAEVAVRRREFDEPIDGLVYGIVASLGFAAAENVHYFSAGRLTAPLVIARCFMSVPAHMLFGALWGHALGQKLIEPKTRAWLWLVLAAACHGLFDALLSAEETSSLAVMLNVGLASVFVVLVRRALRHGIVTKEMLAVSATERELFRVGRPMLFWLSAATFLALALGIFTLGAYHQLARHSPSLTFVVGSSVMLALLAVAALGISSSVPLDVAIDDYGVTFAGAARPWRAIHAVRVVGNDVLVDGDAGQITLGPGSAATIDAIAAALERRRRGRRGGADSDVVP